MRSNYKVSPGRIRVRSNYKISPGHLDLDNDADWLLVLHPVTPTEMESLRVARVIDRARVVIFKVCTERKTVCLHPEHSR